MYGLPWWQRICLECRRPGFDSWVRKIPWRRGWQSTLVFWPRESHGQRSLEGYGPSGPLCIEFYFTFWTPTAWHSRSQFTGQGSNPQTLQWKLSVSIIGPPGKSLLNFKEFWLNMNSFCENVWIHLGSSSLGTVHLKGWLQHTQNWKIWGKEIFPLKPAHSSHWEGRYLGWLAAAFGRINEYL